MSEISTLLCIAIVILNLWSLSVFQRNGRRLHYRDRSAFWKRLAPVLGLMVGGFFLAAMVVVLPLAPALLWLAAMVAVVCGGVAFWVDLDPQRVVTYRHS